MKKTSVINIFPALNPPCITKTLTNDFKIRQTSKQPQKVMGFVRPTEDM